MLDEQTTIALNVHTASFSRAPSSAISAGLTDFRGMLPGCGPQAGQDVPIASVILHLTARFEQACGALDTDEKRAANTKFNTDVVARAKQLLTQELQHHDIGSTLPLATLRALAKCTDHVEKQAQMLVNHVPAMAGAFTPEGARNLLEGAAVTVSEWTPRHDSATPSIQAITELMGVVKEDLDTDSGLWQRMAHGVEQTLINQLQRLHTFTHVYAGLFEAWTTEDDAAATQRRVKLATTEVAPTLLELMQHHKLVGLMQFQATVLGRPRRKLCRIRDALLALPLILDQLADVVTAQRSGSVVAGLALLSAESAECAIGTPLHGFDARVRSMASDTDRVVLLASGLKSLASTIGVNLRKHHTKEALDWAPNHLTPSSISARKQRLSVYDF